MSKSYQYRISHGVWINDLRNQPFVNQDWPCVILDRQSMLDIQENIKLQAESGFDGMSIFGLLTASAWLPDISKTVDGERKKNVQQILRFAKDHGIKILYGLGVYSWGYDKLIEYDPQIRGTNPKVMCASKEASQRWMEKVVDYLIDECHFDGFHLEAADLGRCECPECKPKNNSQYFCEINTKVAAYIRKRQTNSTLLVSLCGYLPKGQVVPQKDWIHFQKMSEYIDCLIDPGHFGTFISSDLRQEFISSLRCSFGTGSGVWLYPPQRWDRLRYFIPYTKRSGRHLENLYGVGGRAIEYNVGPAINPAVELNIAFGGRKLNNVDRSNRDILLEIVGHLYQPKDTASTETLANFFEEAENAFFANMDEVYPPNEPPLGEIHLTYLFGTDPGPVVYLTEMNVPETHAWYLTKTMTPVGRSNYKKRLQELIDALRKLEPCIGVKERVQRIKTCLNNILIDIAKSDKF